MSESKAYWEAYYANHKEPKNESMFARFVKPFLHSQKSLYELGCGNGRDSIFFAKEGVNVTGFDQCNNEIDYLNTKFEDFENISFEEGDFTSLGSKPKAQYIYSRFTLHSINLESEIRTLNWVTNHLLPSGLFFIEVRSIKDELYGIGNEVEKDAFVTDHYRRFLELNSFIERIKDAGLNVLYKIQSRGLAPFKTEDPEVIRIIAQYNS
ncbi:MAG: class I SAM-dependent methyltransferase [Saprospiraceae bacterium]|nr:class I SAM-dependent methyltransferase [Saprospiraceae bacterium]